MIASFQLSANKFFQVQALSLITPFVLKPEFQGFYFEDRSSTEASKFCPTKISSYTATIVHANIAT